MIQRWTRLAAMRLCSHGPGVSRTFSASWFDRHFATIHRYLERRIGVEGANELAGEVFRVAFERRDRFVPLHESALPWLYGVATNLMLKRWRDERRLRALARLEARTEHESQSLGGSGGAPRRALS